MGFQIYWLKAGCFFCYYLFNFVSGGAASLSLLIRSCQRRKLGSDDDVVVVYSFSRVWLFVAPWTAALQASLSLTISQSLPKSMSIASVMLSSHLIFWCPLLLQPSIFPSIRDFSNKSDVHIRWPKYWSFNFSISPSTSIQGWFPTCLTDMISLLSKGFSKVFSSTIVRSHWFFGAPPCLQVSSHNCTWPLERKRK